MVIPLLTSLRYIVPTVVPVAVMPFMAATAGRHLTQIPQLDTLVLRVRDDVPSIVARIDKCDTVTVANQFTDAF